MSLLSHSYKIFTWLLQTDIERTLNENQNSEKKKKKKNIYIYIYPTSDHPQALNQTIGKSHEYNRPLCIGFVDYVKAFEHGRTLLWSLEKKTNKQTNSHKRNIRKHFFYKTSTPTLQQGSIQKKKIVCDGFPITEESDKEIQSQLYYLLLLWRSL